jgi:hypothetical protein
MAQFTVTLDAGVTGTRGRVQYNLSTNTVGNVFNEGFTSTSGTLTPYPNGWVRLTLTTTTSTGTTIRLRPFFSGTGSTVRIWGAQVEEGAFATSYIPTTTATVPRAADVASITGSAFTSFYTQTEGTVYMDSNFVSVSPAARLVSFSNNTSSNRIILNRSAASGGNINFVVTDSGTVQVNALLLGIGLAGGTSNKVAAVYKAADFAGSVNGLTAVTQGTGTVPSTVTQLSIGNGDILGTNTMTGTIKRLVYWRARLPNATLQVITTP